MYAWPAPTDYGTQREKASFDMHPSLPVLISALSLSSPHIFTRPSAALRMHMGVLLWMV
jgi:hypothetical protein